MISLSKQFGLAAAAAVVALIAAPTAQANPYDEVFNAVDWLADKYRTPNIQVRAAPLEPGVYAQTIGNTITVNLAFVNDPAALNTALANDVAHGYHPGLKCSAPQVVAAHEFAHVLDNFSGHIARLELAQALANGLEGKVSGYSFNADGSVNYAEALADAFVAVECDDPTPAQSTLYTMLTT